MKFAIRQQFRPLFLGSARALQVLLVAVALQPVAAWACGACVSPPGPTTVRQRSERVLFYRDPSTGVSTAWVEIRFSGPASDFGWVVPMPKKPIVGVAPRYVFDRLDQAVAPRYSYRLDSIDEGCSPPPRPTMGGLAGSAYGGCGGGFAMSTSAIASDAAGGGADTHGFGLTNEVNVLEASTVGPYDYAIIAASDGVSDPGKALLDWLAASGFATPYGATQIIAAHAAKGDVFVALKLHPGQGVDRVQPVTFTMQDADPCVPLRLTSVAAVDDMDIVVYLLGAGRGLPKNSLHVQVNPWRLNWFAAASNYSQVLAAAIDEAGGHAFATEFAGPAKNVAVAPGDALAIVENVVADPLATPTLKAYAPGPVLPEVTWNAAATAACTNTGCLAQQLSAGHVPMTEELAGLLNALAGEVRSARAWEQNAVDPVALGPADAQQFAKDVQERFVGPMTAAAGWLKGDLTLTRLALRISPAEMTRDPMFAFDPRLPDLTNRHFALLRNVCVGGSEQANAARLRLSDDPNGSYIVRNGHAGLGGGKYSGVPPTANNAIDPRFVTMKAARAVELQDETHPQTPARGVNDSQIFTVDQAVADAQPGKPSVDQTLVLQPAVERVALPPIDPPSLFPEFKQQAEGDPQGCQSAIPGAGHAWLWCLMSCAGLVLARRRWS